MKSTLGAAKMSAWIFAAATTIAPVGATAFNTRFCICSRYLGNLA
jgi:hypothetical protein